MFLLLLAVLLVSISPAISSVADEMDDEEERGGDSNGKKWKKGHHHVYEYNDDGYLQKVRVQIDGAIKRPTFRAQYVNEKSAWKKHVVEDHDEFHYTETPHSGPESAQKKNRAAIYVSEKESSGAVGFMLCADQIDWRIAAIALTLLYACLIVLHFVMAEHSYSFDSFDPKAPMVLLASPKYGEEIHILGGNVTQHGAMNTRVRKPSDPESFSMEYVYNDKMEATTEEVDRSEIISPTVSPTVSSPRSTINTGDVNKLSGMNGMKPFTRSPLHSPRAENWRTVHTPRGGSGDAASGDVFAMGTPTTLAVPASVAATSTAKVAVAKAQRRRQGSKDGLCLDATLDFLMSEGNRRNIRPKSPKSPIEDIANTVKIVERSSSSDNGQTDKESSDSPSPMVLKRPENRRASLDIDHEEVFSGGDMGGTIGGYAPPTNEFPSMSRGPSRDSRDSSKSIELDYTGRFKTSSNADSIDVVGDHGVTATPFNSPNPVGGDFSPAYPNSGMKKIVEGTNPMLSGKNGNKMSPTGGAKTEERSGSFVNWITQEGLNRIVYSPSVSKKSQDLRSPN
jgi:hypothetical protein